MSEFCKGQWFDAFADSHTLRLPTTVYAVAYRDKPGGKSRTQRFLKVFRRNSDANKAQQNVEKYGFEAERLVGTITWEAVVDE